MKNLSRVFVLLLIPLLLLAGCLSRTDRSETLPQRGPNTPGTVEKEETGRSSASEQPDPETGIPASPEEKPTAVPESDRQESEETGEAAFSEEPKPETAASTAEPTQPVESTEEYLEPQPLSEDLTGSYSAEDWQRINTFLSNFSEVFFLEYDVFNERMDAAEAMQDEFGLIQFGYLHFKINDPSKISSDGGYYVIRRADMDKCLTRFFGHTVPTGTKSRTYAGQYGDFTETVEYKNDAYWFPAADGESYNQLTVVSRVMKTARGTYYVEFNVYALDLEDYFDHGLTAADYRMTAVDALLDERLTYAYSGVAELRDYQSCTYRSYQLVDYEIFLNVG